MADLTNGDAVSWNTPQGKTSGKVTRKIESDDAIQNHQIKASKSDPQYEVQSDSSGKKAAHKPDSLTKE